MFKVVMVIGTRFVDMPLDKHLRFAEAAFRAQAYKRRNASRYYFVVDMETGEVFET